MCVSCGATIALNHCSVSNDWVQFMGDNHLEVGFKRLLLATSSFHFALLDLLIYVFAVLIDIIHGD